MTDQEPRIVYLDYAATTPVDARVLEAMLPHLREGYGNPSSLYGAGRAAYLGMESSRESIAASIGASPSEIVFTGGGTEADNAAIIGIASAAKARGKGDHVIVSSFEHHAILESAKVLSKRGFEVSQVKPRADGIVHAEDLAALMRPGTALVSVMHVNNEIGTLQPIRELADVAHAGGALFHTDAVQSLGKVEWDVTGFGADAASFSAHKIYGPKGVGALYLRRGTPFEPLLVGGGQESKRRSGTQNTAGIAGFAAALQLMDEERIGETVRLAELRDRIVSGVCERIPNVDLSGGEDSPRVPHIANLIIKGIEGESMLLQLDNKGISVSTGSACSSGSLEPSHVLLSIGLPPEVAHGSLRITVGRYTTAEDVEYFLDTLPPIVQRLRDMSPVYTKMYGAVS